MIRIYSLRLARLDLPLLHVEYQYQGSIKLLQRVCQTNIPNPCPVPTVPEAVLILWEKGRLTELTSAVISIQRKYLVLPYQGTLLFVEFRWRTMII